MTFDLGPRIYGAGHYALLQHVLTLQPKGTALEFGTGNGTSAALIADYMPVVSFGSQFGLPEKWRDEFGPGSFAFPVPNIDNAEIVEGWFDEILPDYDFGALGHIGLVHLDADLFSSTATALEHAGPFLEAGTMLVFDEFHSYEGCEQHEQRAFAEFLDYSGYDYRVLGHGHEALAVELV